MICGGWLAGAEVVEGGSLRRSEIYILLNFITMMGWFVSFIPLFCSLLTGFRSLLHLFFRGLHGSKLFFWGVLRTEKGIRHFSGTEIIMGKSTISKKTLQRQDDHRLLIPNNESRKMERESKKTNRENLVAAVVSKCCIFIFQGDDDLNFFNKTSIHISNQLSMRLGNFPSL